MPEVQARRTFYKTNLDYLSQLALAHASGEGKNYTLTSHT